jgi:hypothetical protein
MIKNIHEVFEELEAAPHKDAAKAILYYNITPGLRGVLRANFHPGIKFVIDEVPPYRENNAPIGLGDTSIHKEINRVYIFEQNNPRVDPNLTLERKKIVLTQILEGLEAKEAKIFADMLLKRIKVKHLNKKLIEEVFPDIFSY